LIANGVVIAMVIWLLWMANSMTSIACILMASVVIAGTHLRFVACRPAIVHVLIFGMLAVSLYALFLDTGGGMLGTLGRDPTLTGRTDLWQLIVAMTDHPLIGTGFESFWLGKRIEKLWALYWWHPNEAHNGYLEFYLTLGWIGVTLWAAVMVKGYQTAINVFRKDRETGRIMLAYFVVGMIYNVSEAAFKGTDPIWIVFLFAALAVPLRRSIKLPIPIAGHVVDTLARPEPLIPEMRSGDSMDPVRSRPRAAHSLFT
jgi:exopolysaccharide production protein ExoQ